MNILQVSTTDNKGGAASIAWNLKEFFDREGIGNSMFVRDKYSDDPNVFQIPNTFPKLSKVAKFVLSNDIEYSNSDYILETEQFKKADIVHCHNLHGYYFSLDTLRKMAKMKKIVWTFHDMWPITSHCSHTFGSEEIESGFFVCPSKDIYPSILFSNEKNLIKRKGEIYRETDFHIVTPSDWLGELAKRSVLKDKPLSVIYNGIDTSIFYPRDKVSARKTLDLLPDKKIILSLTKGGKENPFYDSRSLDIVAKSFSGRKDIVFLNVGGQKAKRSGNTIFLPRVSDKNMLAELYSASDVFLNPTLADSFSLVSAEAMACGVPVVSFKIGGVPEIVEHGMTGYLANYRDPASLERCLEEVFTLSADALNAMSAASVARVRDLFQQETMRASYMRLYNNILQ